MGSWDLIGRPQNEKVIHGVTVERIGFPLPALCGLLLRECRDQRATSSTCMYIAV